MDHVRKLLIFATVANEGSFTAAAKTLGLTKSSVSKHVASLEDFHNVRLMNRTTRSVSLTEPGQALYEKAEAIREIAQASHAVLEQMAGEPNGLLRVTAPLGIGEAFLAPKLAAFCETYPKINLELSLFDEVSTAIPSQFDVAIRAGNLAAANLKLKKILTIEMAIIAHPSCDNLSHPSQLTSVSWIAYSPLGNPQTVRFQTDDDNTSVRLDAKIATNNGTVIRTMVSDGPFYSMLPKFWVQEAVDRGELKYVLTDYALSSAPVFAMWTNQSHVPLKVRAFVDFLAHDDD